MQSSVANADGDSWGGVEVASQRMGVMGMNRLRKNVVDQETAGTKARS